RRALRFGRPTPHGCHPGLDPGSMNTGHRELDSNRVHGCRIKSGMTGCRVLAPRRLRAEPAENLRLALPIRRAVGLEEVVEPDDRLLQRVGALPAVPGVIGLDRAL